MTKNRFGSLGTVYQRFNNGHFVSCDQDEAKGTDNILLATFFSVDQGGFLATNRPSGLQSALGGAAAGTAIMPGWGTAIGAGVGALASLF